LRRLVTSTQSLRRIRSGHRGTQIGRQAVRIRPTVSSAARILHVLQHVAVDATQVYDYETDVAEAPVEVGLVSTEGRLGALEALLILVVHVRRFRPQRGTLVG
jgi:hypothetical protein